MVFLLIEGADTPSCQPESHTVIKTRSHHANIKLLKLASLNGLENFKAGNIKLSTVEDLKKLIELDIDLQKHDDI